MLIRARKTIYVKVHRSKKNSDFWPVIQFCDRGKCLHIDTHFITLSKDERVYQFTPYRTSYFTIDFVDSEYRLVPLTGFQETVAKALFRNKKNVQFPC